MCACCPLGVCTCFVFMFLSGCIQYVCLRYELITCFDYDMNTRYYVCENTGTNTNAVLTRLGLLLLLVVVSLLLLLLVLFLFLLLLLLLVLLLIFEDL